MPLKKTTIGTPKQIAGTDGFLGPNDHAIAIPVDLSQFTSKEIDSDGYLKPYIPLTRAGIMVASGYVYGVTAEYFKVADDNADATIAALETVDIPIFLRAVVVRAIAEDALDRAYTSPEVAGFVTAGSQSILIYP